MPRDEDLAQFNFNGQTVSISVKAAFTFQQVKEALMPIIGNMPPNKQKLKTFDGAYPKNEQTLAALNIRPNSKIELTAKDASKKKKK